MGCDCQDSPSSDRERQRAFAERALKLAMALPDDVTCRKTYSEPEAQFLSALRNLAAGYSLANNWSESEARSRLESLNFADAAFTYASQVAAKDSGGGPGGGSCSARCNREKETCRNNCDATDGSYWCYFDCRLTYMACLAGCIIPGGGGGGGGGGVVIA